MIRAALSNSLSGAFVALDEPGKFTAWLVIAATLVAPAGGG
jgi:hypothetical protein